MVKKFMKIFGQKVKEKAEFPEKEISSLRYELIKEELEEFKEALEKKRPNRSSRRINRYTLCNIWCGTRFRY